MTIIGFEVLGLGVVGKPYLQPGNPQRLFFGMDYTGTICGTKDMSGHRMRWLPNYDLTNPSSSGALVPQNFGICVSSCPSIGDIVYDPYDNYGSWVASSSSFSIVGYCISYNEIQQESTSHVIFSDFIESYSVIGTIGFLLTIILCMLFLFAIRIPLLLRFVVWSCIWLVLLLLSVGCYVFIEKAKSVSQSSTSKQNFVEIQLLRSVGSGLGVLAVLWASLVCFLRERIALAIGIIKESSAALIDMPLLCFFPLFQTFLFACFTAIWLLYSAYLISSGELTTYTDPVTSISYNYIHYDANSQGAMLILVFVWLWTTGFIEAFGNLASSHAVLSWYFSEEQNTSCKCSCSCLGLWLCGGCSSVLNSVQTCFRYHLGTAAVGSFIVAIVRLFRVMLEYLKTKFTLNSSNRLVKYTFFCLSCCFALFDKLLRYLSKHSYPQCALFGTPFCQSARHAFHLLYQNFGRFAAMHVIGDFVVLIGKFSISLSAAGLGYLYMTTTLSSSLHGVVMPTVLIGFVAFCTSTMFLGVLSSTSDTIMQAFIVDEELQLGRSQRMAINFTAYSMEKPLQVTMKPVPMDEDGDDESDPDDAEVAIELSSIGNPIAKV